MLSRCTVVKKDVEQESKKMLQVPYDKAQRIANATDGAHTAAIWECLLGPFKDTVSHADMSRVLDPDMANAYETLPITRERFWRARNHPDVTHRLRPTPNACYVFVVPVETDGPRMWKTIVVCAPRYAAAVDMLRLRCTELSAPAFMLNVDKGYLLNRLDPQASQVAIVADTYEASGLLFSDADRQRWSIQSLDTSMVDEI